MQTELFVISMLMIAGAAEAEPARRAVVVGANGAAPGRAPLRYAHQDAQNMADVLAEVGGFTKEGIVVLMDPDPEEVVRALDAELEALGSDGESLLLFYYSGHADQNALYPNGRALSLSELQTRLADPRAKVRLGIIDACRGGGWTGAKGLKAVEPFEVALPDRIVNEGTVLIASSSGDETAHEAEVIRGSFFTHHFTAGLRGAADDDQSGTVSLGEAYAYAQRLTVRDAAIYSQEPQHPSYRVELRGRQDLPLAQLAAGQSKVQLAVSKGPLELIHVDSGSTVLELPEGKRRVVLALRPGSYLVRKRDPEGARVVQLELRAGETIELAEEDLVLRGAELAAKGAGGEIPRHARPMVEAGAGEMQFAAGQLYGSPLSSVTGVIGGFTFFGTLTFGLTDRLELTAPGLFAFRFGDRDGHNVIPWAGVSGISFSGQFFSLSVSAGTDLVLRLSPSQTFDVGIRAGSWATFRSGEDQVFNDWSGRFSLGYTVSLFDAVTLGFGVDLSTSFVRDSVFLNPFDDDRAGTRLGVGSVFGVAGREIPLIRVHLTDWASLDGYAAFHWGLNGLNEQTYLIGTTFSW